MKNNEYFPHATYIGCDDDEVEILVWFYRPNKPVTRVKGLVHASLEPKIALMKKLELKPCVEVLSTGDVSITVTHEDGDYLIDIVRANCATPENLKAQTEALIALVDEAQFKAWLEAVNE